MKNKTKKKVFIVGSEGSLGRSLKIKLKNNKKYFLKSDKLKNRIDFSNFENCEEILNLIKPDIIINCAAKTNITFCEKNKKKAYDSNAKIVENLSFFCNENNKKLIQISTDHIYNDKKKLNIETNHSITNYYSYSKLQGEFFAAKCNSLILRVNFFGYEKKNKIKKTLINWILNLDKKEEYVDLYKDIYFSPLHIDTLTSIIIKILSTKKIGIFNLGSTNQIRKSSFILAVAKKLKIDLNYKLVNYRDLKKSIVKRPSNMSMNVKKFQKSFSIELPRIENEIKKIIVR
jgi:dTDP-4-dehydrorhamnose reductase